VSVADHKVTVMLTPLQAQFFRDVADTRGLSLSTLLRESALAGLIYEEALIETERRRIARRNKNAI
jgi:hypothetical protein